MLTDLVACMRPGLVFYECGTCCVFIVGWRLLDNVIQHKPVTDIRYKSPYFWSLLVRVG
jgi:hypothetical protein